MKKIHLMGSFLCLLVFTANAGTQRKMENNTGLYITVADFLNHRVSYTSDKIVVNGFTAGSKVKITEKGEKKTLLKKEIFGYRNGNNEDFRFYKNELYQIVASEPWFVYKQYASVPVQGGKGNIKKEFYYYSIKGDDAMIPLTVDNLKKSFPGNIKFHDLLDMIKSDEDLTMFDTYRKQLMIGYLYNKSQE